MKTKSISLVTIVLLTLSFAVQAKEVEKPYIPPICKGEVTKIMKLTSIFAGDGYHANLEDDNFKISAYCATGDCEILYDYGISNIDVKVSLGNMLMEEDERTRTCYIKDIELNP